MQSDGSNLMRRRLRPVGGNIPQCQALRSNRQDSEELEKAATQELSEYGFVYGSKL